MIHASVVLNSSFAMGLHCLLENNVQISSRRDEIGWGFVTAEPYRIGRIYLFRGDSINNCNGITRQHLLSLLSVNHNSYYYYKCLVVQY